MKTIKEWFEGIPDETLRREMLASMLPHMADVHEPAMHLALLWGQPSRVFDKYAQVYDLMKAWNL